MPWLKAADNRLIRSDKAGPTAASVASITPLYLRLSLDSVTAESVLRLMVDEAGREGAAILMVTHEEEAAIHADRVIRMRDGLILSGVDDA